MPTKKNYHKFLIPVLIFFFLFTTIFISISLYRNNGEKNLIYKTFSGYNVFIPRENISVKFKANENILISRASSNILFTHPLDTESFEREGDNFYINKSKKTSIKYSILENGIKEEILLKTIPETFIYEATLDVENLTVEKNSDGEYVFKNNDGEYQFTIQKPFMEDSKNQKTYNIDTSITKVDEDRYIFSMILNKAWLTNKSRIYPVIIDPTIIHDNVSDALVNVITSDNYLTNTVLPKVRFIGTDEGTDDLDYELQWGTDSTFSTYSSAISSTDIGFENITTPSDTQPFNEDEVVQYSFQEALLDQTTYYYRVKSNDGSTDSEWSSTRSFTINTSSTEGWYQTEDSQFDTDTISGILSTSSNSIISSTSEVTGTPITVNSGSAQTDFDVLLTIDTQTLIGAGKLQSDCDDLRFYDTNSSGNISGDLKYFIESGCNTTTTKIWVRVPNISTGDNTIYMTYNDATLSKGSEDWTGNIIVPFEGSCPSGWSSVSAINDSNRFILGSVGYGSTGGAETHTHEYNIETGISPGAGRYDAASTSLSSHHTHFIVGTSDTATNLPPYVDVVYCSRSSIPTTVADTNFLGIFDYLPSGWTRDSGFDDDFLRGNTTAGGTGGASTHTHTVSGTTTPHRATPLANWSDSTTNYNTTGVSTHTHTYSFTSGSASTEPPYITMILGNPDSSSATLPSGLIVNFDTDEPPLGWDHFYPLDNYFIKGGSTYGTTGGSKTHRHTVSGTTGDTSSRIKGHDGSDYADNLGHPVSGNTFYTEVLPPYITANYAQRKTDTTTKSLGTETTYTVAVSDTYIKPITVSNTGTELTNYNTLVTLDTASLITAGKMKSDCSDLRITGNPASTTNSLDMWIEQGCNTSNTQIWVEVPSLPNGDSTLNFVYGKTDEIPNNQQTWNGNFILMSTGSCPSGYTRYTQLDGKMPKGSDTFGSVGGSNAVHTHSASGTTSGTADSDGLTGGSDQIPLAIHTHTYSFFTDEVSDTPPYLETIFCAKNTPNLLGTSAMLMFDTLPSSGWTRNTSMDTRIPYGSSSYSTTGGATSHSHTIEGHTSESSNNYHYIYGGGSARSYGAHIHEYTGTADSQSNYPPYKDMIFGYPSSADTTIPQGAITAFDSTPPLGWTRYSSLDDRYPVGNSTSAGTGGSDTHTHDWSITTGDSSTTHGQNYTGSVLISTVTDTHSASSTFSEDNNPEHLEVLYYQKNTLDTDLSISYSSETSFDSTVISSEIVLDEIVSGAYWRELSFNDTGDITYQILYDNSGTLTLVPDVDLSDNSTGFTTSPVNLGTLGSYTSIYIKATFSGTSTLNDWTVKTNTIPLISDTRVEWDNNTKPDLTPQFSAKYLDPEGDDSGSYEIEVNTASDFTGTVMWDSDEQPITIANGETNTPVTYAGTTLISSTTYYWRMRFWDEYNAPSAWSTTTSFTVPTGSNFKMEGLRLEGIQIN